MDSSMAYNIVWTMELLFRIIIMAFKFTFFLITDIYQSVIYVLFFCKYNGEILYCKMKHYLKLHKFIEVKGHLSLKNRNLLNQNVVYHSGISNSPKNGKGIGNGSVDTNHKKKIRKSEIQLLSTNINEVVVFINEFKAFNASEGRNNKMNQPLLQCNSPLKKTLGIVSTLEENDLQKRKENYSDFESGMELTVLGENVKSRKYKIFFINSNQCKTSLSHICMEQELLAFRTRGILTQLQVAEVLEQCFESRGTTYQSDNSKGTCIESGMVVDVTSGAMPFTSTFTMYCNRNKFEESLKNLDEYTWHSEPNTFKTLVDHITIYLGHSMQETYPTLRSLTNVANLLNGKDAREEMFMQSRRICICSTHNNINPVTNDRSSGDNESLFRVENVLKYYDNQTKVENKEGKRVHRVLCSSQLNAHSSDMKEVNVVRDSKNCEDVNSVIEIVSRIPAIGLNNYDEVAHNMTAFRIISQQSFVRNNLFETSERNGELEQNDIERNCCIQALTPLYNPSKHYEAIRKEKVNYVIYPKNIKCYLKPQTDEDTSKNYTERELCIFEYLKYGHQKQGTTEALRSIMNVDIFQQYKNSPCGDLELLAFDSNILKNETIIKTDRLLELEEGQNRIKRKSNLEQENKLSVSNKNCCELKQPYGKQSEIFNENGDTFEKPEVEIKIKKKRRYRRRGKNERRSNECSEICEVKLVVEGKETGSFSKISDGQNDASEKEFEFRSSVRTEISKKLEENSIHNDILKGKIPKEKEQTSDSSNEKSDYNKTLEKEVEKKIGQINDMYIEVSNQSDIMGREISKAQKSLDHICEEFKISKALRNKIDVDVLESEKVKGKLKFNHSSKEMSNNNDISKREETNEKLQASYTFRDEYYNDSNFERQGTKEKIKLNDTYIAPSGNSNNEQITSLEDFKENTFPGNSNRYKTSFESSNKAASNSSAVLDFEVSSFSECVSSCNSEKENLFPGPCNILDSIEMKTSSSGDYLKVSTSISSHSNEDKITNCKSSRRKSRRERAKSRNGLFQQCRLEENNIQCLKTTTESTYENSKDTNKVIKPNDVDISSEYHLQAERGVAMSYTQNANKENHLQQLDGEKQRKSAMNLKSWLQGIMNESNQEHSVSMIMPQHYLESTCPNQCAILQSYPPISESYCQNAQPYYQTINAELRQQDILRTGEHSRFITTEPNYLDIINSRISQDHNCSNQTNFLNMIQLHQTLFSMVPYQESPVDVQYQSVPVDPTLYQNLYLEPTQYQHAPMYPTYYQPIHDYLKDCQHALIYPTQHQCMYVPSTLYHQSPFNLTLYHQAPADHYSTHYSDIKIRHQQEVTDIKYQQQNSNKDINFLERLFNSGYESLKYN